MNCQYKNAFGKPGTGLHSYRICNIAIIDVLATIGTAFLISWMFSYSFLIVFVLLIILSIIMHRLFCVRTTVDKFLFKNPS